MNGDVTPAAAGLVATAAAGLDQNPAAVYLAAKPSAVGRRGLHRSLDRAAELLTAGAVRDGLAIAWHHVRYQHVAALRSVLLEQGAAPATINHVLAAVRGTLREAWRLGLLSADALARATDVASVAASPLPAGRHVDAAEIRALFASLLAGPAGARDAALLSVLYGGGLRRSEAVALDLADYDQVSGALTVRSGKGRKDRVVYAANGGRAALDAWVAVRGDAPGALLQPVDKAGKVQQRGMGPQAVLLRLRTLAGRAGVRAFSPHDLRRSFVGELLDAGADIASVQHLAGHASVNTTARYDRRGEGAKRRAAELLHVPYQAPGR